jgi:hypothetical protein
MAEDAVAIACLQPVFGNVVGETVRVSLDDGQCRTSASCEAERIIQPDAIGCRFGVDQAFRVGLVKPRRSVRAT